MRRRNTRTPVWWALSLTLNVTLAVLTWTTVLYAPPKTIDDGSGVLMLLMGVFMMAEAINMIRNHPWRKT